MILVDLFCGCGGFSLGAHRAGFNVAAAFDIDADLTSSYHHNFPKTKLVLADISKLSGVDVVRAAGGVVNGIFGGPPCQGFSDIGKRRLDDPRRELAGHFFRVINEVRPEFFVMENVKGLAYADARGVLDQAMIPVNAHYSIFGPQLWDAAEFGAATRRKRLFVIGIRKDKNITLTHHDFDRLKRAPADVNSAIGDLRYATSLGEDAQGFDRWRISKPGRPADYARGLRATDGIFTGHRPTVHTRSVSERFAKVIPGKFDLIGRHPRLDWKGQCPTLRAGTGSDKGSFQSVRPLHPDEPRVITVREAARLQGFPDTHQFHPTVWHSFRMIGNSVSPIMSTAVFNAIAQRFGLSPPLAMAA